MIFCDQAFLKSVAQRTSAVLLVSFLSVFLFSCSPKSNSVLAKWGLPENLAPEKNGVYIGWAAAFREAGLGPNSVIEADRDMRVAVAQQLKSALFNHYSLYELKAKRIKASNGGAFDSNSHLDQCIARENSITDTSDLNFVDRMKECVAGFQDTHLSSAARIAKPGVSVGILARRFQGKYYIYARQPDLLDYVKKNTDLKDLDAVTAVGNEILEIDGKNPADLAAENERYVNASTPGYRQIVADISLFNRNFLYPTKPYVTVKIKGKKSTYIYRLPWWAAQETRSRLDAAEYFQNLGIPTTDRVKMAVGNDGKVDWTKLSLVYQGYILSNPLVANDPFHSLATFTASGAPAARMGTITTPTQNFCYLQYLTFSPDNLKNSDGVEAGFIDVSRKFIKMCKANNLNLVMDLRSNGGGNGSYPAKILSLLAPTGARLGNKVMSFRVNAVSARLISALTDHPELAAGDMGPVDMRYMDEFKAAAAKGLAMTGAVPEKAGVEADSEVGGYSGKIVVLVTPSCISACDGTAAILSRNKRAVVLGTHTNGTGAGFQGTDTIDSSFQDTFDELKLRIPNYQFGYSPRPYADLNSLPYDQVSDEFFTENIPTVADVAVDPTLEDILGNKNTWLEAVTAELSKP